LVDLFDKPGRDLAELAVELGEILVEQVAFELVRYGSGDEAAQAAMADSGFDSGSEVLVDAHRPLGDSHSRILPQ